ncbi:MAG: glycosyltransferase family 2 protein [Candidatus Coatesbacteria bacterium]|nr:glycosyltransferase family 2 protein [Candidatus Coatesbacteria bacterium]
MNISDIAILMPAYNPGRNLKPLLEELLKSIKREHIWVVNDGCTDDTQQILENSHVNILVHKENKGKGASLKFGFENLKNEFKAIITMDADGQHDPSEIPLFIKAGNEFDLVIGDRQNRSADMPFIRKGSNWLNTKVVEKLSGMKLKDSQCGYRLIKTDILKTIQLKKEHYELEGELLIKACKKGFKIGFVPVRTIYNDHAVSHIKPVDILRFSKFYLNMIFRGVDV